MIVGEKYLYTLHSVSKKKNLWTYVKINTIKYLKTL